MNPSPDRPGTRYGVPTHRQKITDRLTEAYGNNMLEQRDFEARLERAQAAETIEELDAVVADFGPRPADPSLPMDLKAAETHFSLLGNQNHILVPGTGNVLRAATALGDITIDLRAFRGSGQTLTVQVRGGLGSTRLRVPEGTRIVKRASVLMGDYRVKLPKEPGAAKVFFRKLFGRQDPPPASPFPVGGPPPTVIVLGFVVMGDLVIEEEKD